MINWLDVDDKGFETEVILINRHVPTGPNSFLLQYGITVKKPEGLDDKTADFTAYQLRRWYEQFYVDVADVAPEMTDRFEFEVDTDKANEYWQAEVAENLKQMGEADQTDQGQSAPETADA